MVYKHFRTGVITQDLDTGEFSGTIDNIHDYVFFKGSDMHELEQNFHIAVDNYIAECERVGKKIEL